MFGETGRPLAGAGALVWSVLILLVCLTPNRAAGEGGILLCLICADRGTADLLLNAALFLPLGLFLRIWSGSWRIPLALGFFLSLGVEVAQLWIPGRFTTLADLIANTVGSGFGALLVHRWSPGDQGRRLRTRGAIAATILVCGVVAAPSIFFAPSRPAGALYGNWTPQIVGRPHYEGRVISADIDGVSLPSRQLRESDEVRLRLGQGGLLSIRFEVASSPLPSSLPIFRLLTEDQAELIYLAASGADLFLTTWMRADDARLDRPGIRVASALADREVGDTLLVRVRPGGPAGIEVTVGDGEPNTFGWTLARGWALLWDPGILSPEVEGFLDRVWVLLLFFPLGWAAASWRRALLLATLPLALLVALPRFTPVLPTSVVDLLVAVGGVILGLALRAAIATEWWRGATPPLGSATAPALDVGANPPLV